MNPGFPAVLGRGLLGELPHFVHRPFLVVTMADLWPLFGAAFDGAECHSSSTRWNTSPAASSSTASRWGSASTSAACCTKAAPRRPPILRRRRPERGAGTGDDTA